MKLHEDVIGAIQSAVNPICKPDDLGPLVEQIKDKKVVLFGEATHGTAEFYQLRSALSQILIKDHGFSFVAVEGDWPDATRLRRYIQKSVGESAKGVLQSIHRWPRWMWANTEVADFAERLKGFRTPFYGLDVYSLFESMEEVLSYLNKANPLLARRLASRYACFNSFGRDEIAYARSLLEYPQGCQSEVISCLEDMLRMRMGEGQSNEHDLFDAQQNARIARNAEDYYRAMLRGDASSWNVRDQHMQETLELLLEHHGPGAKAIVWAHNTHVGDYRATDMLSDGYVNLGGLSRQRFGTRNVALVGFATYQGKVIAGPAWGAPEQEMTLPPAMTGSMEECFHVALDRRGLRSGFLVFDDKLRQGPLCQILGHRAVGVVYDPRHERRGQYVPTALSERYDAFIFVDETTAVHPIHGFTEYGDVPETWPMGQ